jgi:hypothetical protein
MREGTVAVARLGPYRMRGPPDVETADLVTVVAGDPGPGAHHCGVAEGVDQVGGEPVDEAVAVRWFDPLVVVVESNCLAVGADADEQCAAIRVEEPGDGLDDGVFDGLAGLVFPQFPSGGGLEFDGEVLDVVDQLGAG